MELPDSASIQGSLDNALATLMLAPRTCEIVNLYCIIQRWKRCTQIGRLWEVKSGTSGL